tara:strand:- start:2642 stop:3301 length:660 start_codon:yes stop_codon:yes gene_type:complete
MKLTQHDFPAIQYYTEEHPKTQIYLHHTAGNADPFGTFNFWASNPIRVATCVTIGGKPKSNSSWADGEVAQGFSSKYWAYHLGLKTDTFKKEGIVYKSLDKISVAIEICNFGPISFKGGKYYTYVGSEMSKEEVVELDKPFKGYKLYHAYTDAQIAAVKDLLLLWKEKYKIPLTYNEDIWDVTVRALKGEPGVYTHNSVRSDKSDVSPQPKLIQMLKSL